MKYDTAGNPINELIANCHCGKTGGCEICNPVINNPKFLTDNDWGEWKKKEIRKWRRKFDKELWAKRAKLNKIIGR